MSKFFDLFAAQHEQNKGYEGDLKNFIFVSGDQIQKYFDQKELQIKMSSVMLLAFNAVGLYVVTINGKPWTHVRELCKALRYEEAARRVARHHCSRENIQHKYQLAFVPTVGTTVNWPRVSQKLDLYINEEEMYELLFSSQQPKVKYFRRRCYNVLFPHVRQQLTKKVKKDHQQPIKEKDAALALLKDDLQNHEYERVAMQAQRDVYQTQLQKCQDRIGDLLINHHVPCANDPGKDNIVMIIEKNTAPEEDEFYEYPYYIARMQRGFISTKTQCFMAQYSHHRFIKRN